MDVTGNAKCPDPDYCGALRWFSFGNVWDWRRDGHCARAHGGRVFSAPGLGFKPSCDCPHVFVGSHLLLLVGAHCLGSGIVDDDWNAPRRTGRNLAARAYA